MMPYASKMTYVSKYTKIQATTQVEKAMLRGITSSTVMFAGEVQKNFVAFFDYKTGKKCRWCHLYSHWTCTRITTASAEMLQSVP